MNKHLHIVTHDVPWPTDYGGLTDLFYKLKALHQLGVNIHLHCFTRGRMPQDELNKYCSSVTYYNRKKNISRFSFSIPFIVNSRANADLITNLQKDNYPVLLEGIHCTYYLNNNQLNNRKVFVRLHNVEFEYYKQLAKLETGLFKKLYFLNESRLLKKYEKAIANKATILAVSKHDVELYQKEFHANNIYYLPVFLPYTQALGKCGKGSYCLYHGNLSINENEKAATCLFKNVFNEMEIPFVIAGKNPSKKLIHLVHKQPLTRLVANPSENEMQDLISRAQIHVLPSFNNTGIKLKLFNALFNGRHCLVNPAAVEGSGLEKYCHVATDTTSFKELITELDQVDYTEQENQQRQNLLNEEFNNEKNAKKLMELILK